MLLSFCENIIVFPPKSGKDQPKYFEKIKFKELTFLTFTVPYVNEPKRELQQNASENNNNKSKHHDPQTYIPSLKVMKNLV